MPPACTMLIPHVFGEPMSNRRQAIIWTKKRLPRLLITSQHSSQQSTQQALEGDAFTEALIQLVKEKRYLWDIRDKRYKDTILVIQTWSSIVRALGLFDRKYICIWWMIIKPTLHEFIRRPREIGQWRCHVTAIDQTHKRKGRQDDSPELTGYTIFNTPGEGHDSHHDDFSICQQIQFPGCNLLCRPTQPHYFCH